MTGLVEGYDAIVIGGGPAGASVAAYLAREGRKVIVLEREHFPREHIGESLLPGVLPYLDALGARDLIEDAGFERKEGQTFVWGRDRTPWQLDFRELDVYPYAFFVLRSKFDELLLRHAARSGAEVHEGTRVIRVLFEAGRAIGVTVETGDGARRDIRARFIVDASGQSALVARGASLRRPARGLKNVALWSYWRGHERLPGPQRSHILTVSIPEGWVWSIPLADRLSVGIVTSHATRAEREALGPQAWYERTLRATEPVAALLTNATQISSVTGARDWSYRSRRFTGPGIFLVGDSACFIDPILSTGVHMAMSAAFWCAACVHTSLVDSRREALLRRFYDEQYATMYRELLTQVRAFYASEVTQRSVYWASKRVLRAGSTVAPDRAFLFITAGLLRNAATSRPDDPAAEAQRHAPMLPGASRARHPGFPDGAARRRRSRNVSPPLVWRLGAGESAQLVTLRASGLTLDVVPHVPRGLHDRPRDSFFVLDIADAEREPLAMAIVERRRSGVEGVVAGSWAVSVRGYPMRASDPVALSAIREQIIGYVADADRAAPGSLRSVRAEIRRRLRQPGALPSGAVPAAARELRAGGVAQPPMTAVFDVSDEPSLARVYVVVEARAPIELTDVPMLRTRFLDVWVRPDGASEIPRVDRFLDGLLRALSERLRGAPSGAVAFDRAEALIQAHRADGFSLVMSGRLGDIGPA